MIRRILGWSVLALLTQLASCGGGGGAAGDCALCGDGGGGTTAKAASLLLALDTQSLPNSGSDKVNVTVTALDSNNVVVADAPVVVAVDSNAVVVSNGSTTDSTGTLTATVGIGTDRSNRVITVTVISGSLSKTSTISVTGSKITASLATTVEPSSVGNKISYRVVDVNSNPLVGEEITVTAPGLTGATGVTSASGTFDYVYTAPAATGSLVITATAAGVTDIQNVQVQSAGGGVPVAVGPISSASITANPKTVATNALGSSDHQTQIRALFQGAANAPIKNIRVRFDLNGDPNSVGGSLASGSSQLYSSAEGVVTTAYIPGVRSGPTDGVSVRACWDYDDFAAGACPNQVTVALTVTAEPISVTIGTDELIYEGDAKLTYIKKFVVMVVDSAGVALPNVTISPVLDVTDYSTGRFVLAGVWTQVRDDTCSNEDVNRNGVLDLGEDVNSTGILEPRKADVSVRMVNGSQTDSGGMAVLQLEYPKNVATWDFFKITVSATGVSGTEGVASFSGLLPPPASAITTSTASPAFQFSPYGSGPCD